MVASASQFPASPRYIVRVRTCQAPSSRGGKYRRPVVVRVLDTLSGASDWHWVRACPWARQWSNVDSRYDGPRSAYGQALAAARDLADQLNAAELSRSQSVAALNYAA